MSNSLPESTRIAAINDYMANPNDSLWTIAKRHNTSAAVISKWLTKHIKTLRDDHNIQNRHTER